MAYRDYNSQSLHDRVISFAVGRLDQINHDVYSNPGSYKNAGVGDKYPDIIITGKGSNTIKFIIEVETADSINLTEATNQWKKYANEINASFYLLVPSAYRQAAINLCKQVGISARFGTFEADYFGNVTSVNYE